MSQLESGGERPWTLTVWKILKQLQILRPNAIPDRRPHWSTPALEMADEPSSWPALLAVRYSACWFNFSEPKTLQEFLTWIVRGRDRRWFPDVLDLRADESYTPRTAILSLAGHSR
jgi:hypothetical protein